MDRPEGDIDVKGLELFLTSMKNRLGLLGGEVIYETGWFGTKRKDCLLLLEKEDYYQGPLHNDDRFGEDIWVFGKRFDGRLCYIKIYLLNPLNNVYCVSFLFAEYDMYLPLRGVTENK